MANCYKCLNYESSDSSVGLPNGCNAECLYDADDKLIPEKVDEILEYLHTDKECPWMIYGADQ